MNYSTYGSEWYDETTNESYKYIVTTSTLPATQWEPPEENVVLEAYYIDEIPVNKVDFLQRTQLNEGELFDGTQHYSDYLPEDFNEYDGWR